MLAFILFFYFLDGNKLKKLTISVLYAFFEYIYNFNILNFGGITPNGNNELCPLFSSGELQLTFFSIILTIFNPGISKNVFYGKINETDSVVLKILPNEPKDDVIFCDDGENSFFKNFSDAEPMLLQILDEDDYYPVPKYLGSCHNIILEEYKGDSLLNYYSYSWKERAFLALQLVKLAKLFTFGHPKYAFYFTDLSPDNLVVDDYGKVSLIDLDNVIIKNKYKNKNESIDKVHVSTIFDDYYLSFSSEDICKHPMSDHNYLAVCQYILIHSELMEGGLLHDIPKPLSQRYPALLNILRECAKPNKYPNRIEAGRILEAILHIIVKDFKWDFTCA